LKQAQTQLGDKMKTAMIIAALMMALAIVNTCKGESQRQYPRAIPRAIPAHPDELGVLPKLTAREWILNNTIPEYMKESFELALDEPLVTDVPYQAPHQYHPRYNDQMERMIRDPECNNEKTNNYQTRRVYSQGEFVGYIIVQVRESQAPVTVPAGGTTARQWLAQNIAADQYAFECTFDKSLVTKTPYQPPRSGSLYYDEQLERAVGKYAGYNVLHIYERGAFIGYAVFIYLPPQPTVTI
jgi:hypothetical protein